MSTPTFWRKPLTVRALDGSEAVSPFYAGMEQPLCAWDQCDRPGKEKHHIIEPDQAEQCNVWWFFCSHFHKDLHSNSSRTYASVKPGESKSPYL